MADQKRLARMGNFYDNRLSDIAALGILSLLILWFCQDLILQAEVPFLRDLGPYFYPLRYVLYESFRAGEVPLWNSHLAMGFPFLAAFQSGVFYPPHLFLMVLPFFLAIRVLFIFHFLAAGIGTYCLCRHWKFPPYLALVAAILFSLGGVTVSLTNLLNHFQTAVWLPWVILSWEMLLRSATWKHFIVFTAITAIQFLAGSPELFAMSMVLVILDGMRIRAYEPEISPSRVFGYFLSVLLLVLALVMVQLLPTAELFLESRRRQPIIPQEALHWSLKPQSLLNLFFLDKEIDVSLSRGIRLFFSREAPFFVSHYTGAICLFGVTLWFYFSSLREKLAMLGLLAVSLIVALGIHTPIYPLLYRQLPFLGMFRFPEKVYFFSYVVLLYMACTGLGGFLLREKEQIKGPILALVGVCLMWFGLYVVLRLNLDYLAGLISAGTGNPVSSSSHAMLVASTLSNLERQVVLLSGLLLLITLVKVNAIRVSLFGFLIVSAVFVDLAWAHRGFLFPLRPDFVYERTPVERAPEAERGRFFYFPSSRDLHPSSVTVWGRPAYREATALSFQVILPNAGVFYGIDYFQEIDALGRQPYTDFLFFANRIALARQVQLLRTFNVKYLVTFQPISESGIRLVGHFPQFFCWLYRVEKSVPRAYIVNHTFAEKNAEAVLQRLSAPGFDPRSEVVLDEKLEIKPGGSLKARAEITRYENEAVTVQTSSNHAGILVLADSFYPGWNAYIDGERKKIYRANLFFRAVQLPSGQHTVEFRYEPRSFMIGLVISLATITCLTLTSLICYLRNRK